MKEKEVWVAIIVGDYTAKQESWLKELEALSNKREDGGLFHSGVILWVQSYLSRKWGFTLKAAIAPILDAVPSLFPKDLPQQLEKVETMSLTDKQVRFLNKLNKNLILPIEPIEIIQIILAGQEYEALSPRR